MSGFGASPDETVRWGGGFVPAPDVRHHYPLAVRSPSFTVAVGLMLRSLPYAMARFGVLLAYSVACVVWLLVTFGVGAWLGTHIAAVFGWVWIIGCLLAVGVFWGGVLRYALHLIECGHVAVLTELITKGTIGYGNEGMFAYGKRIVAARFVQASVLYGLNALVRGVVRSFHNTLDWIGEIVPVPGLQALTSLVTVVLRAATRYLDKVIFSYNLARESADPWTSSREGLVYYCQNAKPVLITAVWSVVLERVLTVLLWLVLLVPAGLITLALPAASREMGGVLTVLVALLLAGPIRAAFIKPVFLIMPMVRFHSAIEGQPINAEWDARLASVSSQFRELGEGAAARMGASPFGRIFG